MISIRSTTARHAAALLLAAAATAACGQGEATQSSLELETSTAERRDIESTVEATGTVEPLRVVEVKSQAGGEILNMPVELGDRVEQGELLIEIDPRDEQNQLEQASADLEQAEARLEVAKEQLNRAQVLRDSGVVTATELESARLEYANARSSYVKAQTSVELAREQRADATVSAPITGTIISRQVEQGQIITSTNNVSGGTTLLEMADLAEVRVRTLVDESDIGRVRPGLPVGITVEAYPDTTFQGEVHRIEPQSVEEQNVTMFPVLIRIPNEEGNLRPGMNADVEIVLGQRDDVLALPNSGIKMPSEARELVNALGMDESLLEQQPPGEGGAADGASSGGQASADGESDGLPSASEFRSMSMEERKELMASLSQEERQRLMERIKGGGEADAGGSGQPRTAFVFVRDANGQLTLRPVRVGLSSFEYTEILSGLSEGDTVVEVPLALIQQQEMLERFRSRSGVPGMGGN